MSADPRTPHTVAVEACHDEAMRLWLAAEDDETAHALHAAMEALTTAARAARALDGRRALDAASIAVEVTP